MNQVLDGGAAGGLSASDCDIQKMAAAARGRLSEEASASRLDFYRVSVDTDVAASILLQAAEDCGDELVARFKQDKTFYVRGVHLARELFFVTTLAQATHSNQLFEEVLSAQVLAGGDVDLRRVGKWIVDYIADMPFLFGTEVTQDTVLARYERLCEVM